MSGSLEGPANIPPTYRKDNDEIWREIRKLWAKLSKGGTGRHMDKTWVLPGRVYPVTSNRWYAPNFGGRIVHILASLTTAGSTNTVLRLLVNGVVITTITMPANEDLVFSGEISEYISGDTDYVQIQILTAGNGAIGLTAQLRLAAA